MTDRNAPATRCEAPDPAAPGGYDPAPAAPGSAGLPSGKAALFGALFEGVDAILAADAAGAVPDAP